MAEKCSACEGDGWYYTGDWRQGYPKGQCAVCRGAGTMERDPQTGRWGPPRDRPDAEREGASA